MNFKKIKDKVYKTLKKNGSPCCITRVTDRVYNKDTDEYEEQIEIIKGYGIVNDFDLKNVDGKTILMNDVNIMCVLDEKPQMNEVITIGDIKYTIVNVNPYIPDGVNVIYYSIQGR